MAQENQEIDIYLPYEDLPDKELEELVRFVESVPGKRIYPLYVGAEFKGRVTSNSGINIEAYYRVLGIELLPEEVKRILYLDVDMVVKGSLWNLYHTEITGHPFVACEDIFGIINGFHAENMERLGIPAEYTYFNTGVLLLNVEYLRKDNAVNKLLQMIYQKYKQYLYNEQDAMNELYYDKVLYVGWDEYNCPPAWYYLSKDSLKEGKVRFASYDVIKEQITKPDFYDKYQNISEQMYESAAIIHYMGETKPWNVTRQEASVYELFDRAYRIYYEKYECLRSSVKKNNISSDK